MHLQRFFLTPESIDVSTGVVTIRERGILNQMKSVLRLKQGDAIRVLDDRGMSYECVLLSLSAKEACARIRQTSAAYGDPQVSITVALPLLRGGRFEWALQKLTELGVRSIIPFTTSRSVVKPDKQRSGSTEVACEPEKLTRWRAIVREAAEQCERACVPSICEPVSWRELLARLTQTTDIAFICAERSQAPLLSDLLHTLAAGIAPPQRVALVVGPEGGFTTQEIDYSLDSGLKAVSLGPRILRSETAAIFSLAQIITTLGDA
jgi:16S rRNA (uracil1498-N3)-methyltransferase